MKRVLVILLAVVLLLAVAAGSFWGGTLYGKQKAEASLPGPDGVFVAPGADANGGPSFGQARRGQMVTDGSQGGLLVGEIEEIGDGILTITDQSGKKTQVNVTNTTLIQKQASVTLADLAQGETVMVSGSQSADGSITARSVQVTSFGGFGGLPGSGLPGDGQQGGGSDGSTNP